MKIFVDHLAFCGLHLESKVIAEISFTRFLMENTMRNESALRYLYFYQNFLSFPSLLYLTILSNNKHLTFK